VPLTPFSTGSPLVLLGISASSSSRLPQGALGDVLSGIASGVLIVESGWDVRWVRRWEGRSRSRWWLGDNGGCGWGVGEWVLFVLSRLGFGALRLNDALRRPKVRRRNATRLALLPGVDVIGKQPTFTLLEVK
jgi:hypothetical protein